MNRLLLGFLVTFFSPAAPTLLSAVDLSALIKDSQRVLNQDQRITIVWWIPDQFWEESFRQQSNLTSEQKSEFQKVMEPYTVFCVGVLDVGPMGGIKAKNKDLILANTSFRLGNKVIAPLAEDDLSPDARNFFAMMKPVFGNMMGQLGQGLEFVVYRKNQFVEKNMNPLKKGSFEYEVYGQVTRWRLPLGSLLPKKIDPSTKEEFSGDYEYNPFTGAKLEQKSEP